MTGPAADGSAAQQQTQSGASGGESRADALSARAAMISAGAAAVGLVATAASVFFSGWQTDLARKQAVKAEQELEKRQARLINIWPDGEFRPDRLHVIVTNRSREPIYNVRIYVTFGREHTEPVAVRGWNSFIPCTQVVFDLRAIARSYTRTAPRISGKSLPEFDYGLMFVDVSGRAWHSRPGTSISPNAWLEPLDDGTRNPKLPNYLRENRPTLLEGDNQYTTPVRGQRFVRTPPREAEGCPDSGP